MPGHLNPMPFKTEPGYDSNIARPTYGAVPQALTRIPSLSKCLAGHGLHESRETLAFKGRAERLRIAPLNPEPVQLPLRDLMCDGWKLSLPRRRSDFVRARGAQQSMREPEYRLSGLHKPVNFLSFCSTGRRLAC